jgi:hypothetical protein
MVGQRRPAGNLRARSGAAAGGRGSGPRNLRRARDRPPRAIGYDAPAVPCSSVQRRSLHRTGALVGAALLGGCYSGDFFDRLVDPDVLAAFRITEIELIDPHFYSGDMLSCTDSTATYNEFFAEQIGAFDINPTLVLRPLDPSVEVGARMQIVPAVCVPGDTIVNCTDKQVPAASIVEAEFNNQGSGMCGAPVAGSLNPKYMGGANEPLSAPVSPCFVSALIPRLDLPLGPDLRLPLSNVQIAAAYSLDGEPKKLVQGVLFGFLPASLATSPVGGIGGTAFTPWNALAGGASCQPDSNNPIDDIDTVAVPRDGVWMYFNFTAEEVAWTSESGQGATDTSAGT